MKKTLLSFFSKPSIQRIILWMIIFTTLFLYLFFLNTNRFMPALIDGFQYFHVQYYFLNHQFIYNETPFWIPYLTHGTVSTWWYSIIADIPFLILSGLSHVFSSTLSHLNFLHIFNAEMIFDELILALGTWLLCKRYRLSDLAAFYAAMTMIGCSIWQSQPWYNFHLYHALPLILYLGHRFLDTSRWRYLFLCGNLVFLQTLGNLYYLITVTTLCITVYFVLWVLIQHKETFPQIRKIKITWKAVLCLIGIGLSMGAAYAAIKLNTSALSIFSPGRNPDLSMGVADFMSYGGDTGLKKWDELFFGISPFREITLFIGYFPILFCAAGLTGSKDKTKFILLAVIIFLVLFSMATPLSQLLFYIWPGMNYFRHIGLTAPLAKMFIILLSTIGLEYLLQFPKNNSPQKNLSTFMATITFLFALVFFCFFYFLNHPETAIAFFKAHVTSAKVFIEETQKLLTVHLDCIQPEKLHGQIFTYSIYLFLSLIVMIFLSSDFRSKYQKYVLFAAVGLHIITLFHYKIIETEKRSVRIPQNLLSIMQFGPIPYRDHRLPELTTSDNRDNILQLLRNGTSGSANMFLFKDTAGSAFRVDHWLAPLNNYMKIYWGQNIENAAEAPAGYSARVNLIFPFGHQAAEKISGITEPKIQFFKNIHGISDDKILAPIISDPHYTGDILFATTSDPEISVWDKSILLNTDERITLKPTITFFNANHVKIDVDVPADQSNVWLHYADIWDPLWSAAINDKPTTVYRSNAAYKAVKLNPGHNDVHFRYDNRLSNTIYIFWQITALLWGTYLFRLLWKELRTQKY